MRNVKLALIPAVLLFLLVLSGCTITGRSSELLNDEILSCSLGTGMAFMKIGDVVQACYSDNSIYFAVENMGTTRITGLSVSLESDYPLTMNLHDEVSPGQVSQQSLGFGSQSVAGGKLTVYPFVGESRMLCTNAAVSVEIGRC